MPVWILWTVFGAVLAVMMALDLGVFHRKAHEVSVKEALGWTAAWVAVGLLFCGFVWLQYDHAKAAEYLACYLTETIAEGEAAQEEAFDMLMKF